MNTDGTTSSATVAQTAEQRSRKATVAGSMPAGGSIPRREFLALCAAAPLAAVAANALPQTIPAGPSKGVTAAVYIGNDKLGWTRFDQHLTKITLDYLDREGRRAYAADLVFPAVPTRPQR